MKTYDWILRYGENQQHEMQSGFEYCTKELAMKKGEEFIRKTNAIFQHYPNPKIEVVEIEK